MSKQMIKRGFPLTNEELRLQETLFHTANGYIGVRGNFEEGYPTDFVTSRGQYINGVYDIAEMKQAEQLYGFPNKKEVILNVADTQTLHLYLNGEEVTAFSQGVRELTRILDMEKGTALRTFDWKSKEGQAVTVSYRRMTSFVLLPLFTIEVTVTSHDFTGEISILSEHHGSATNFVNPNDPRMAAEAEDYLTVTETLYDEREAYSKITAETKTSELAVQTLVFHDVSPQLDLGLVEESDSVPVVFDGRLTAGETARLVKYSLFLDSRRYNLMEDGILLKQAVQEKTLEEWYQAQEEYLQHFWKQAELSVGGDPLLNESLDYSLYSLIQSTGKDGISNIAAKGLSGEGYEGHYFWDTEIYMMPFFTLTNPEITGKLIEFRYTILDKARENARILGHKQGALFPWRTISGTESSGYYPSGTAQYHINSDIAYSIIQYYQATGDLECLIDYGGEILIETSRLWLDAGHYEGSRFVLNCMTGPDEYTCVVNNNYYTNQSVQYQLRWLVKHYPLLKEKNAPFLEKLAVTEEEIAAFEAAAKAMYLPYSEELQIHAQDDSFLGKPILPIEELPKENFPLLLHYHPLYLYRHQVCKQADMVLAYFLHDESFKTEEIERGYTYYEKLTTHDSSLSSCIFSIVANQIGDVEKAYRYFEESSKIDITNSHHNTQDGIHAANMGGTYLGLVFGFAGLRIREDLLELTPRLPKKWTDCRFSIKYQGSLLHISVDKEKIQLSVIEGAAVPVSVYGQKAVVSLGNDWEIPYRKER
ncbi:glycoside hydrolase family 65 protein [Enterococcus sp. BWR-S5]|uniref:glycoside hydrolase family 65 protein n=1 Tax=Enterococcus sp. BWR-S5 TaxID=2787714 RepID=UPI0019209D44|nr:glycoside hydrolase family 65 protein [Enterococcus sp. BWR-S5]MBL1226270.1 glycoside hydrolase family 65 protein [Enterococcus sp. BWR-S5]